MRHPLLLAALTLAAVATAASAGKETVYYTITLQEARIVDGHVTTGAGDPSPVTKVDSFTVKQGVKPAATGENVQGAQDIVITGSRIPQPNLSRSKQVVVIAAFKPGQCTTGKRYPAATVAGVGRRYELRDVVITGCARSGPTETITFVYGTLR